MEESSHAAVTLTEANFDAEVTKFSGLVLVDFWAEWCTPCLVMGPRIEELAQKYKANPNVKIGKLDVDANQAIAERFSVLSLPTFKLFSNGEIVDEMIGAVPAPEIEKMIERVLPKLTPAAA